MGRRAGGAAVSAFDSPTFAILVRSGFVARGLTYGIVAVLAGAIALGLGTDGTTPNQQGALNLLAREALGKVALVAVAAGLLAYALWKIYLAAAGAGPEGGGGPTVYDRISNGGGGIAYLAFFGTALRSLLDSGGGSAGEPHRTAAGVLAWPAGVVLVAGAGILLIVVSLFQIRDALGTKFAQDNKTVQMAPRGRRVFLTLGYVGLIARALVFVLVGWFLLRTAIEFDPRNAVGVDGALARLHQQVLGAWLVGAVAAGLLVFASFSLLEARYRKL